MYRDIAKKKKKFNGKYSNFGKEATTSIEHN